MFMFANVCSFVPRFRRPCSRAEGLSNNGCVDFTFRGVNTIVACKCKKQEVALRAAIGEFRLRG
jgi:hypothetical protein